MRSLLALQDKDRMVMEVEAELAALQPELDALDEEVRRVEEAAAQARQRATSARERREALEGKIESYRVMQERRRQKLEWVRGAKEASTLMAEIDLARSVMAREEAEWMRSADEVSQAEAAVEEAEAAVVEVTEGQAGRRAELQQEQDECRNRLTAAIAERESSTSEVERSLLNQYERIRKGRAPLALYSLHDGACGHCYTAVPLHLVQQLGQSKGAATCEACGVMIYIDSE